MHENRTLVRGDNLEEMRQFPNECIDLIATDPLSTQDETTLFHIATNAGENQTPL